MSRKPRVARVYGPDEIKHGLGGHKNWHCRCEVCARAWEIERELIARRRRGPVRQIPAGPRGVVTAAAILEDIWRMGGEPTE